MTPELSTQELTDTFGEERVRRFEEGELPAGVSHAATRRFLTAVGIPTDLQNGFLSLPEFEPLAERHSRENAAGRWVWDLPGNAEQWYVLGGFFGGAVALDGSTGTVHFIPDGNSPPEAMHNALDALAYFMFAFQRDNYYYSEEYATQVDEDPDDDRDMDHVYLETALRLARELMRVDPTPFTIEELPPYDFDNPEEEAFPNNFAGPWTGAFEDVAGGMWD